MGSDKPRAADHSLGFIGIGVEANPFKEVNQELKGVLEPLRVCTSNDTIINKKEDNLSRMLVPNASMSVGSGDTTEYQ